MPGKGSSITPSPSLLQVGMPGQEIWGIPQLGADQPIAWLGPTPTPQAKPMTGKSGAGLWQSWKAGNCPGAVPTYRTPVSQK